MPQFHSGRWLSVKFIKGLLYFRLWFQIKKTTGSLLLQNLTSREYKSNNWVFLIASIGKDLLAMTATWVWATDVQQVRQMKVIIIFFMVRSFWKNDVTVSGGGIRMSVNILSFVNTETGSYIWLLVSAQFTWSVTLDCVTRRFLWGLRTARWSHKKIREIYVDAGKSG